jgi:hypothetical protein
VGALAIYKGNFKKGKAEDNKKKWEEANEKSSKPDISYDEFCEALIYDYLTEFKDRLSKETERLYTSEELEEILKRDVKPFHTENPNLTMDTLKKQLKDRNLYYFKIDGEVKLRTGKDSTTGKPNLTFSLLHELFELHQFRGELYPSFDSVFSTITITTGSPHLLIYIAGNPYFAGKVQRVVHGMLSDQFKTSRVFWGDQQLRNILSNEMSELLTANARKVEDKIRVGASSAKLEGTALYTELKEGEFSGVTYMIRNYPSNRISINGSAGIINSDLADDVLIQYIKDRLLPYAT